MQQKSKQNENIQRKKMKPSRTNGNKQHNRHRHSRENQYGDEEEEEEEKKTHTQRVIDGKNEQRFRRCKRRFSLGGYSENCAFETDFPTRFYVHTFESSFEMLLNSGDMHIAQQ